MGTKHKRLLNAENKLRVARGVVSGRIGKEDSCWDEYWLLYIGDKSLESTPEIIIVLYAN